MQTLRAQSIASFSIYFYFKIHLKLLLKSPKCPLTRKRITRGPPITVCAGTGALLVERVERLVST